MDLRVYTRPGSDWTFDGHGFQIGTQRYQYDAAVTDTKTKKVKTAPPAGKKPPTRSAGRGR
jgi:hypothetical protein